jgi:hypothetical protein
VLSTHQLRAESEEDAMRWVAVLDELASAKKQRADYTLDPDEEIEVGEQAVEQAMEQAMGANLEEAGGRGGGGSSRTADFDEGDEVEADYRGKGSYMTAVVTKAESGARGKMYDLVYEDGRSESKVPGQYVRALSGSSS